MLFFRPPPPPLPPPPLPPSPPMFPRGTGDEASCPWVYRGAALTHSNEDNVLVCWDGTRCNWDTHRDRHACCMCHGGRAKCPKDQPFMATIGSTGCKRAPDRLLLQGGGVGMTRYPRQCPSPHPFYRPDSRGNRGMVHRHPLCHLHRHRPLSFPTFITEGQTATPCSRRRLRRHRLSFPSLTVRGVKKLAMSILAKTMCSSAGTGRGATGEPRGLHAARAGVVAQGAPVTSPTCATTWTVV